MKNIEINRKDAIEALTETEAAILDVLIDKVQTYSARKQVKELTKSNMIQAFAEKAGIPVKNVKFSEVDGGFMVEIDELHSNPFSDIMGVPKAKKEAVDPSLWNIAFDMAMDPNKYEIAEDVEINQLLKAHPLFSFLESLTKKD